jgi:hypothetical protein
LYSNWRWVSDCGCVVESNSGDDCDDECGDPYGTNSTGCTDENGVQKPCDTYCDCEGNTWDICGVCDGDGLYTLCEDLDGDGLGAPGTQTQVCDTFDDENDNGVWDEGENQFDDFVDNCIDEDDSIFCVENSYDCSDVLCGEALVDNCNVCDYLLTLHRIKHHYNHHRHLHRHLY